MKRETPSPRPGAAFSIGVSHQVLLPFCIELLLLLAVVLPAAAGLSERQHTPLRREATHRPRRLIFNNDGNEPVVFCRETPPATLETR